MNKNKAKIFVDSLFETDEYGRVVINDRELMDLCGGAQLDALFPDSNSACHDNGACGDAECGNAGC